MNLTKISMNFDLPYKMQEYIEHPCQIGNTNHQLKWQD